LDNLSWLGRIHLRSHDSFGPSRNASDSDQPAAAGVFPNLITPRHDSLLSRDAVESGLVSGYHPSVPFLPEYGLLGESLSRKDKTPAKRRKPNAPQNNITRHVWSQMDSAISA
jgi:hypothetical protein